MKENKKRGQQAGRKTDPEVFIFGVVALIVSISVAMFILLHVHAGLRTEYITATVIEKFVDEGNVYFTIETATGEQKVLSNEDSILRGKFNSRDFVSKIEVGKTYNFTLNGLRIPILSMNLNILEVTEVEG